MSKLNSLDFTYISGQPSVKFMEECAKIATNKPRGDNLETQLDYIIYDVLEYMDKNLDVKFMESTSDGYQETDSISGKLAQKWFAKDWDKESNTSETRFLNELNKKYDYWKQQPTEKEDIGFNGVWSVLTVLDCCGATQDFAIQMYENSSRKPLNDVFHELLSEAISVYTTRTKKPKGVK